jgi:DNA-directed RNA polymerase specialized sigma24 family protein
MVDDEVTQWLSGLARGEERAVEEIWRRYFERLIHLARTKLAQGQRRAADEEDMALSAFHSFCRGAAEGRFPHLADRHDLWRLLVTITARKVSHHVRRSMQQKRGSGAIRGESVFADPAESDQGRGIGNVLGTEPTPEFAASAAEQCERLLSLLPDEEYRTIALWKLEGYTNDEIAAKIPCAPRTVERKLGKIREFWQDVAEAAAGADASE